MNARTTPTTRSDRGFGAPRAAATNAAVAAQSNRAPEKAVGIVPSLSRLRSGSETSPTA